MNSGFHDIYDFISAELWESKYANIIEIGAHMGSDTKRLYDFVGKDGLMFAFEPDPRNFPLLKKATEGLPIVVIEKAIGAKVGMADLFLSSGTPPYCDEMYDILKDHTASSSLKAPIKHLERFPWVKFENTVTVEVTTLDNHFINGPTVIDLIWADVQGAEIDMIKGGQSTLEKTRFLFTEFNNEEMYSGQVGLETLLKALPGNWGIIKIFGDEVLLQNTRFGDGWICTKTEKTSQ